MPVPYTFGSATSAIPLSQLDANFATTITLGNTAIQLGNTVTTLNNMTLANVTISSGSVTITSATVTSANVTSTLTLSGLTASTALALDASKNVVSVTNTGTGNNVLATSPTLVTPVLGTPTSGTLTNCTGYPTSALSGNINLATQVTGTLGTTNGGTGLTSFTSGGAVYATSTSALTTGTLPTTAGGTGLSSFTANGVVYASSTSALTTGSALTFDGTTQTITAAYGAESLRLQRSGVAGQYSSLRYGSAAGNYGFTFDSVDTSAADPSFMWRTSIDGSTLSERMRLTSTGLGIGTSSPGAKLDVNGTGLVSSFGSNTVAETYVQVKNGTSTLYLGGSSSYNYVYSTASVPLTFWTNSAERMRLDSSGNLGLGVTPSAWRSSNPAFQIGQTGSMFAYSSSNIVAFGNNVFIDSSGNEKYITTATAGYYRLNGNSHQWFNAGSGTAGNTISFTQAMTLDASGNLGVGTTSPGARLNAVVSYVASTIVPSLKLSTVGGYSTDSGTAIDFGQDQGTYSTWVTGRVASPRTGSNWGGSLTFSTNDDSSATALVERARITSGGYFKASNNGTYYDSTGFYHEFRGNTANSYVVITTCTSSSPLSEYIQDWRFSAATPNDGNARFWNCEDSTANRAYMRSNGGLSNYQANDTNLSDRREKTNFAPAKSYLDTICAIPVQTFNYIDQSEDDPGLTLGVVAQDVQAVAPELVMESNWGTAENPKMRLSIYQTDLQYALMKCIQELKAQNDDLRARVAQLEAK